MKKAFALACMAGLLLGCAPKPMRMVSITPLTPPALAKAQVLGIGHAELTADGSALLLTEGEDSKGVVLLSERRYGPNLVMSFQIRPLQHEGVCVALLNVSHTGRGALPIPPDYDGDIGIWRDAAPGIYNYFFAFHTAYHQPNAFVQRNPGAHDLAREPDQATGEEWRSIEIGHAGGRVWMKVDGEMVLDGRDPAGPLPAGHLGFRLRGPGDGSFSVLIKDVIVEELP